MSYKRPLSVGDDSALFRPFRIPMPKSVRPVRANRKVVTHVDSVDDGSDNEPSPFRDRTNKELGIRLNYTDKEVLSKEYIMPLKVKRTEPWEPPALGSTKPVDFVPRPLHDPCGEFAIVLYDPTIDDAELKHPTAEEIIAASQEVETAPESEPLKQSTHPLSSKGPSLEEILGFRKEEPKKKTIQKVPVVIDPRLAKILRPHQVEGVKFLYKCTTGLVDDKAFGCIMADEMGLGKTLQCITLLWTLLKQSPESRKGTISKAIIVCPSSLVRNWANELVKWLGPDTLPALAIDGKSVKSNELADALRHWSSVRGREVTRPVLIISYETLRRNVEYISDSEVGLLLADEGHRLKNGDSLTFSSLDALNARRRVILSGTPIQNDLSEYFSLISFANPGLLGNRNEFKKNYENKILRARDSEATEKQVEVGNATLSELLGIVNKFIIRRTNDILSKYLPVKYEHVVFCNLEGFQKDLYQHYVATKLKSLSGDGAGQSTLNAINVLKKICNHPDLIDVHREVKNVENVLPEDYVVPECRGRDRDVKSYYSGKFMVLERMLHRIHTETNDKIVLISNYTQTLDLIEKLCRSRRYGCIRLDGTLAIGKRQKLVDRFNDPESPEFIFLLSSKAGGCGINLIGANRLILLDPDWNPAADQQALARVWRDGQKKDCFVYRFIATGTIEEKIYQRQSMKQTLSSAVVDENADAERLFSFDDLRKLFLYNSETLCETHDTFKCKRCDAGKQLVSAPAHLYGAATTWEHYTPTTLPSIPDKLLQQEAGEGVVSFVFQYKSH